MTTKIDEMLSMMRNNIIISDSEFETIKYDLCMLKLNNYDEYIGKLEEVINACGRYEIDPYSSICDLLEGLDFEQVYYDNTCTAYEDGYIRVILEKHYDKDGHATYHGWYYLDI